MIKGLAITPPVIGRISIGKVVEKNGKRLPEKDDQFTITTQVQDKSGNWIPHWYDEALRKTQGNKIRSIPVRLLFNEPDLNFRADYCLFDRKNGRPMCVGDGESCKRYTANGMESLPCPTPDACEIGKGGLCKPYGRLTVQIMHDEDEVGTFIFRTTGFNSIRTLTARLHYFQAVSADLLACMPLALCLRAKSTTQSHRTPIYYADLTVRNGKTQEDAIAEARETDNRRKEAGYDQAALDAAAREGFANGAFEDSEDEAPEIVEEFFPEAGSAGEVNAGQSKESLKDKLDRKAAGLLGESP